MIFKEPVAQLGANKSPKSHRQPGFQNTYMECIDLVENEIFQRILSVMIRGVLILQVPREALLRLPCADTHRMSLVWTVGAQGVVSAPRGRCKKNKTKKKTLSSLKLPRELDVFFFFFGRVLRKSVIFPEEVGKSTDFVCMGKRPTSPVALTNGFFLTLPALKP